MRSWMSKLLMGSSLRGWVRPHRPGPNCSSRVGREKKGGRRERYLRAAASSEAFGCCCCCCCGGLSAGKVHGM